MEQRGENNPAAGLILYSFRRCPYAMRARLALHAAELKPEHREILLRDKAPEFLTASPKGTVPVLITSSGTLEESLDIMFWALSKNDPERLLERCDREAIAENDGPFKEALDRYKYPNRYDTDPIAWRERAGEFLSKLDERLDGQSNLHGDAPGLTDLAIFPFVRQFANTDRAWFDGKDWSNLQNWLARHLNSARFAAIMAKYPKWNLGDPVTLFGDLPLATGEKSHQG